AYKEEPPNVSLNDLSAAPIYRGHPKKEMVAFLINVSWGTEYIPDILTVLKEKNIKATFFIEGKWAKENAEHVQMIFEEGHVIGNHAYSHPDMARLSNQAILEEINQTNDVIEAIIEEEPTWFAPPSGSFSDHVVDIADNLKMETILWTVDTIDWKNPSTSVMINRVMDKIHPGATILMHPTASIANGLGPLIEEIESEGYELGTIVNLESERSFSLIQKHTCKNGVRTVLENIPTVRSVTIGIWVLAGSRNETKQTNGISHFLEHMFFKGTKTRTAQDIAEAFDSIGGQVNAFTSKEYTCYYARVLDSHKEYALDILADMFFNSKFDEEEMAREKKVILEEIKMSEDTPDDIIHDLLANAAYDGHPLGYPILGTEEHLNSFTSDSLRNYIREKYVPENIVISVAGNVDEAFISKVEEHFGSFESEASPTHLLIPDFHSKSVRRQKDTEQAHLCMGYPGLPVGDEQVYSLILMNNVLGGSMSSRLFQEVRENRGLAYPVFSYHS